LGFRLWALGALGFGVWLSTYPFALDLAFDLALDLALDLAFDLCPLPFAL
jgi:hypothetical protein